MKRNKKNKINILLIVAIASIFCSSCGQAQNISKKTDVKEDFENNKVSKNEIITVHLHEKFINLSGKSTEDLVENIKSVGEENYIDVYKEPDGTVTVEITQEQQKEYWQPSRGKILDDLQEQLKGYNPNYRIEYNNSFTEVNLYYNQELSVDKAIVYVIYCEYICASYQLFSGVDSDEWKVFINIYNSDTGKLVKSGNSDADMTYDNSDWEASK